MALWAAAVLMAAGVCAEPLAVTFAENRQASYQGRTHVATCTAPGGAAFTVSRTGRDPDDGTAWRIVSDRTPLPPHCAGYALAFSIRADSDWLRPASRGSWINACRFHDAAGKMVAQRLLDIDFRKGAFADFLFSGAVPPQARTVEVAFGIDMNPSLKAGETVVVTNLALTAFTHLADVPPERRPDLHAPLVRSDFASPSPDPALRVRYALDDATGVDWASVAVTDLVTHAAVPFVRDGEGIVLAPGAAWSAGCHRLSISVRDVLGHAATAHKAFLVGESPPPRRSTLRDDGVMLLEGRPFYPLGIYGIKPHAFNGQDFVRACADLRAAGFNAGHAYRHRHDPAFLSAAAETGLKLWTDGKGALTGADGGWFLSTGRADPATIAWYIGDDTSMNTTPQQLLDRDEACRMLDGARLTCHADGVAGDCAKDSFQDYVRFADVFMPELYPIDGTKDERCVAEVCRDMDRCRDDIRRFGDPRRPVALWAILQCFHGKSWKRYPVPDEMQAMAFAAVVHGANGILWFHYAGDTPEPKTSYSGIFRTPEDWAAVAGIVRRIGELAPVLLARTPPQPPPPEVLAGPAADPLGRPSVTALVKEQGGRIFVMAVNAAPEPVRVRFRLAAGAGEALWEGRRVDASGGGFEDGFGPFGVHVYRLEKRSGR